MNTNQPSAGAVKLAEEIIVGDNLPLQFAQTVDRHVAPLIDALTDLEKQCEENLVRITAGCFGPNEKEPLDDYRTDAHKQARAALQQWKDGER